MKSLFILSTASGYGGAERSIELILRHLPADVRVCVFAQNPMHIAQLSAPGALPSGSRLVRIGATDSLAGRRRAALRLAYEYWRQAPDALLLNTQTAALLGSMLARFVPNLGQRCHLYIRDFLWSELDYVLARLPAARVLLPSAVVAQRCGYLSPTHLQPHGPTHWSVMPDMVELPEAAPTVGEGFLHLATVNPWKGHAELLMASHHLQREGTPVQVLSLGVNGHPDLRQRLHGDIGRLGLQAHFRLIDHEADPSARLRDCRAVVVCSVSHSGGPETFGRTLIEAWAHGKPVIAYAAGAPGQLIRDGEDGLLVPEADTRALARAMRRLQDDPALCRRLGAAGRLRAQQEFQAADISRRLIDRLFEPTPDAAHAAVPHHS